ncbi:MAG TPA: hypothetical protein VGN57_15355 [Pirellulaceae bacterium]|nr:hypothetical protein [Pirellulaceae bacterium]
MPADPYEIALKRQVRETLLECGAASASEGEVEAAFEAFRSAVLAFGLRTSENAAALDRIDFGVSSADERGRRTCGLRIKASGCLLTDVLWRLEDEPMPEAVRAEWPALAPADWAAALRVATMLLATFETAEAAPGP